MSRNLDAAVEMIEHFEGMILHSYRDVVGVWTIGFGHTGPDVHPGMVISQAQALELLQKDLEKFSDGVFKLVKVPLLDNELSALVSFAYNVGLGDPSKPHAGGLAGSTLLKKLNAGAPKIEVANELLKWVHAGGRVLSGLVRRRKAERELFLAAHVAHALEG